MQITKRSFSGWVYFLVFFLLSACSVPLEGFGVKPLAPDTPSLTAGSGSIIVTWKAVVLAEAYNVYCGTETTPPSEPVQKNITGTTATIAGLFNDTNYYVWVQATNSIGVSALSDTAQLTIALAAPVIQSVTVSVSKLEISWNAVDLADSYTVYCGTETTPPSEPVQKDIIGTTATITGLINDTNYYVWVQAVNAGGISALSAVAQSTLFLAAPVIRSVTTGLDRLIISWNAVELADSYSVYCGTNTAPPSEPIQANITGTTVTLTGLSNGNTYYVWVQAVNPGGKSALSEVFSRELSLETPTILSATKYGNSLTVYWNAVNLADSYNVYCGTEATLPPEPVKTNITDLFTTITGLTTGVAYYVWVQAINAGGPSPVSGITEVMQGITFTPDSIASFSSAISAINTDTAGGSYFIYLMGDFTVNVNGGFTFTSNAVKTVTITGRDQARAITLASPLFTIPDKITLILNGSVKLQKSGSSIGIITVKTGGTLASASIITNAAVNVEAGGAFTMTGGSITASSVGGVYVEGAFTMTGGSISGNTADNGGGVRINGGSFAMTGGSISGNTARTHHGGGVYITGKGAFTMNNGSITNNRLSTYARHGGGVYIENSSFIMTGGSINGNTGAAYGGGVYAAPEAVFTKTGGSIDSTNTASTDGRVAYVAGGSKRRNTTAGQDINLDSAVPGAAGGWE
jgi:fibronectin type 3 domain-containing protein